MSDGRSIRNSPAVQPELDDLDRSDVRGETVDFDDFYRADFPAVVGLAYALTGSRTAAEELAQEAFVAAFRRWNDLVAYDEPGAWVRRVLVNRCRSWGRRRAAEIRAITRLRGRRQPLARLEPVDDEFWAAVRSLPARQAQVVALHYLEDISVAEIAEVLGITSGSVKTHLHRGRRRVAVTLGLEPNPDRQPNTPEQRMRTL